jgi:hypothetical protein
MRKPLIAALAAALATLVAQCARAQCTKDTDCKGDRVCQNGECVSQPAPAPAPAPGYVAPSPGYTTAPPPPAIPRGPLSFFQTGYATVGLLLAFHGWGGYTLKDEVANDEEDGDLDNDFVPGFRIAGYGVLSESFHIGGYWTFFKADMTVDPDHGESMDVNVFENMLGLTMKFGARLNERIWLGGATDVGVLFSKGEVSDWGEDLEMKATAGLVLFPRVDLDVLIVDTGAFRLAFTAALGLFVSPINGGHPYDTQDFEDYYQDNWGIDFNGDDYPMRFWLISPSMMLALSLGA